MSLRLKGLETTLRWASPSGPVSTIAKVQNLEINTLREILEEEYLGEDSPDFDDYSKGVEVKCSFHHIDPRIFQFFNELEDRSRRIANAAGKFSIVGRLAFPSGAIVMAVVPDLYVGDLPFKVGSRKAYSITDITAKAKRVKWVV